MPATRIGLLISPDLFFTSKVTGTAQALGLNVEAFDDLSMATARLSSGEVTCVLFDLSAPRASVTELFAALPTAVPVIAFGSHVNVELLSSAKSAGAVVMPRSQFAANLPDILKSYLAAS
jgi:FixJ family two-component response regulator